MASDYFARQQVLERLQGIELPSNVQPTLAPLSTPIGKIYRYRLRGDKTSPTDLRSLQDWVVARHLKMTPGVADVVSFGGFIKQYQVNLNPDTMKAFNVTLRQLFTALGRGNANAGGSYLERGEQQFLIRGIGLLRSSDDIGNIVVAERDGTPVLIKHLAQVSVSAVPRQGIVGQDDDDEVVSGIVLMRKGENPSEVLTALKERVKALNTSMLLAMLGLLPMALSHGIGSEVQKPLAVVIIGGLISATALTLIVLPTLYLLCAGRERPSDAPEHGEPVAIMDTP